MTWRRVLTVAVGLWVLVATIHRVPSWAWAPSTAIQFTQRELHDNCDIALLLGGARDTPTLRDTLKWWHGAWIGQVPFWRPLTSLIFWTEIRAFGPDRLDGWVWVSAVLHLVATCLVTMLAARLSGSWQMSLLVALLFGGATAQIPFTRISHALDARSFPSSQVLGIPAAQPELWVVLTVVSAVLLAVSERWLGALLVCGLAVTVKEMGWTSFPLCLVAIWSLRGWRGVRGIPRWVWGAGMGLVTLLLFARWTAGPEVLRGFRMGTNTSWPSRLLYECGGPFWTTALQSLWAPALWAGVAFVGWVLWGRRGGGRRFAAAVAVGLVLAVWAQTATGHVPLDVALTQLLTQGQHVSAALLSFLSLCVAYAYFGEREGRRLRLGVLAVYALTTAPWLAATQVQGHALYLQSAFAALMVPLTAVALDQCLQRRYPPPLEADAGGVAAGGIEAARVT